MATTLQRILIVALLCACAGWHEQARAQGIENPGFEEGLSGWIVSEQAASDVRLARNARSGAQALELVGDQAFVQQQVRLEPNSHYLLRTAARGAPVVGIKVGERVYFERPEPSRRWQEVHGGRGEEFATI